MSKKLWYFIKSIWTCAWKLNIINYTAINHTLLEHYCDYSDNKVLEPRAQGSYSSTMSCCIEKLFRDDLMPERKVFELERKREKKISIFLSKSLFWGILVTLVANKSYFRNESLNFLQWQLFCIKLSLMVTLNLFNVSVQMMCGQNG